MTNDEIIALGNTVYNEYLGTPIVADKIFANLLIKFAQILLAKADYDVNLDCKKRIVYLAPPQVNEALENAVCIYCREMLGNIEWESDKQAIKYMLSFTEENPHGDDC